MEDQKSPKQPTPIKQSAWKSFMGKKWAFPAVYISTAAIILAFVMWFQGNTTNDTIEKEQLMQGVTTTTPEDETAAATDGETPDAVAVSGAAEPMAWPVGEGIKYDMGMGFFDDQAPKEQQEKALVKYEDSFVPHTGIDLVSTDDKPFEVTAALAGKVTKVENDPLVGNFIEIEHKNGIVSVYQSLEKVTVKINDEVTKGQAIGTAGRNIYEKEAGIHLHFEVRSEGKSVDPTKYLTQVETQ
ncbi:M23 family metallopeptidase [Brevibacillus dissolubilis]|uniref:M23 family metallopeptidase n=1 Tax=Brevibacillus dissolubilis TaxID=1844116 RepID=UPI00111789B5|nr:M23 family metallopeptidase [Brevibacillus dissolubilis]